MASTTAESFIIQPWTRNSSEPDALKHTLARVSNERGHFRDITETSLQEEIAADGALELSSSDDDEREEELEMVEKGREKPSTREELFKAKYELLGHVRAAEQELLMLLDFTSLMVSKDAPKQGASTMSPYLKDAVPMGSLGMDLWQRMPVDKAREAQDELLATNVKMEGLQKSANDLLSAATRLQDNVRKETEYWNQVLNISEAGWNVCRIPGQQHRLAVRFGFSESSPEFSRRGMAALNLTSEGKISLERGVGRKPRGLYAVLRKDNRVVGTSKLPSLPDIEATGLEARIRYARDSLYDEELYHEMIRESRTMSSLGVSMEGSAIRLGTNADTYVSLNLVSLDEATESRHDPAKAEDMFAQATVLATRLLLNQAHRERTKKRSELPPPLSDKRKDDKPLLPILRPLMSFFTHQASVERLKVYLDNVIGILHAAKVDTAQQHARVQLPAQIESSDTAGLISILTQPWNSEAQLKIRNTTGEETVYTFTIHTDLASSDNLGSTITLSLPTQSEMYRCDNLDDFSEAADAKISSGLAASLLTVAGDEWACDEIEALLTKDTDDGETTKGVRVVLSSGSKALSISSSSKRVVWSVDGECSASAFWDAATELLKS